MEFSNVRSIFGAATILDKRKRERDRERERQIVNGHG